MNPTDNPPSPARAWLRAYWSRVVAGLAFTVVAGVTGRISYVHIQALTLALHQPASVAQIMPFGVDGLIVVGSVALLQAGDTQPWLGWVCVAPGAVISLFANVESYIVFGIMSAAWAGVASLSFILATFTLERWLKGQLKRPAQSGSGTPGEPSAETFPGACGNGDPGVPHPLTALESLEALLVSCSERDLEFLLGVNRNRIRAWRGRLEKLGEAGAEAGDPGADEPEPVRYAALNGSAAGA